MAEVKASLLKVEKKIELVEEEIEQVKAALKNKGTYLGSNGRKWQQDQLLQLQEKEQLLMEDKRQLREKELGLLSPQKLAPVPAETANMIGDHHAGSSGGSSSAPPNGSDTKVVNVDVRARANALKPAVVYHTNGTIFELPSETIQAVDGFEVPQGFQRSGRREQSFMYSLGVYVKPVDPNDRRHKYFCLATSSCRMKKMVIPCKNGDRSNVNTHHKKQHKLRGAQGAIKAGNQQLKATTMHRSKNAVVGISRVRELMAAKMIVEKFLPFTFFSSGTAWAELVGVLTSGNTPFPALPARRVKHLIVEMYVATKKVVVGNMLEEIKKAPLAIFHQGLRLWTCKVSGRKYLTFYGFYVDSKFVLRNVLLRVKHYAPSAAVHEAEKASKPLFTIFKATLAEYGIGISDVAGGTTDSDPVVKAMCTNILLAKHGIPWDCCTCHLVDKAVENAFGTSGDPQKSTNKEARDILKLVITTAARVNQSATFKQRFEEIEVEMLEEFFRVTKDTPRRWLSLVRTLERIIRLWYVLRQLHVDDGEEFPLDSGSNKDAILQLYSLLQPLSVITRDGQPGDMPMTAEIHMALAVLKIEVLDLNEPLKVFDIPPAPCSPEEDQARDRDKPPLPSKMVLPSELHPIAAKTRKELSRALLQGVYARVWDTSSADPSPYRDAAVLLTPPYNTGSYLNALRITQDDVDVLDSDRGYTAPTSEADLKQKLADCWTDINARALAAATKQQTRAAFDVPEGQQPLKRLCTGGACSRTSSGTVFSSFGRTVIVGGAEESKDGGSKGNDLLGQAVQGEIMRYRELYMDTSEVDCKTAMSWWGHDGKIKFPYLAPVAQQVFGNQATAAQVERDFSACGNLLEPNRSRVDTYWVEMIMFLKANYEHIPAYGDIPMISADEIRACIPARFDGRNTDLLAAEAVFDVLENTETPPVDGMTMD